jgi:hypothetical protein
MSIKWVLRWDQAYDCHAKNPSGRYLGITEGKSVWDVHLKVLYMADIHTKIHDIRFSIHKTFSLLSDSLHGAEPFLRSRQLLNYSRSLKNPKVYYRVHKSPPLVPLSSARWIQSIPPHSLSLRSISILSSTSRLDHSSGLFPSSFSTKIVSSSPHTWYIPRPHHYPRLDHSDNPWRRVEE